MISKAFRTIGFLACMYLILICWKPARAQDGSRQQVEIDGLRSTYASCELANFSVKNVSSHEVYVEVYVEKFTSGSWNNEDYPYDIKDPRSMYIKRVIVNPDMLKPNAAISLTYDRCLHPAHVKENKKAFRKGILEKDAKEDSPILQRVRVDVYVLDEGHVKFAQKVPSQPFNRIADKKAPEVPLR